MLGPASPVEELFTPRPRPPVTTVPPTTVPSTAVPSTAVPVTSLAEQAEVSAQTARAFAELSATATWTPDAAPAVRELDRELELDPEREPERGPDDGPVDGPADQDPPARSYGAQDTDTAALLRELASLGLDDDPAPVRTPGGPPRPVLSASAAAAAAKKRKGLFGRS